MRGLSVDNCLVKVIMFSTLPPMPDRAIDHSINSDIAFGTHWPLPKDKGIAPGNVEIGGAALLALSR